MATRETGRRSSGSPPRAPAPAPSSPKPAGDRAGARGRLLRLRSERGGSAVGRPAPPPGHAARPPAARPSSSSFASPDAPPGCLPAEALLLLLPLRRRRRRRRRWSRGSHAGPAREEPGRRRQRRRRREGARKVSCNGRRQRRRSPRPARAPGRECAGAGARREGGEEGPRRGRDPPQTRGGHSPVLGGAGAVGRGEGEGRPCDPRLSPLAWKPPAAGGKQETGRLGPAKLPPSGRPRERGRVCRCGGLVLSRSPTEAREQLPPLLFHRRGFRGEGDAAGPVGAAV